MNTKTVENLVNNGDKRHKNDQYESRMPNKQHTQVDNKHIGNLGETLACEWLVGHNFTIVQRNYNVSFGEIDIIAKKVGKMHYIEVKSILINNRVSRETYSPWNNITKAKVRTIISVSHYHRRSYNLKGDYQIDGISVLIDITTKKAYVEYLENINI